MTAFELLVANPSIADLAATRPHLRRFVGNCVTVPHLHQNNKIGVLNAGRYLRVGLDTGDVERVI